VCEAGKISKAWSMDKILRDGKKSLITRKKEGGLKKTVKVRE